MSLNDTIHSDGQAARLRIAHVGNYKPESTNGVNKMIGGLAKHLAGLNIDVQIWNFTSKEGSIRERHCDGIRVIDLPYYTTRVQNLITLPRKTFQFLEKLAEGTDLIHLHSVFKPENIWVSGLGRPYVITPHNGYNPKVIYGRNRYLKKIWIHFFEKRCIDRSSLMHAVSIPELDNLKEFAPNIPSVFIPNGVDSWMISEDLPRPSDCPAFVYIGRLAVETKGLDLLIKGYAIYSHRAGGEIPKLLIAGPDSRGGRRQLEQLAKELGLKDSVVFEDAVTGQKKLDMLAKARVFVHTSRWEGMPTAVLEAQALSRPVLVTPETNMGSYVENFRSGWVTRGTPQDIADALVKITATTEHELNLRGMNGRNLVKKNFVWPAIVEKLADIYQEVVR